MGEKITDKIDLYDVLGVVVPGTLLIAWLALCFPHLASASTVKFPEAFATVALLALSLFLGYLIQAVASLIEPVFCWMWRGKHSSRVFQDYSNPCLSGTAVARIREKLAARLGSNPDDGILYQYAASLAETHPGSRSPRFNSLYAFHRALLVLTLVVAATLPFSGLHGLSAGWSVKTWCIASSVLLGLLLLLFNRTRERSVYYVRETVLTAERVIDTLPSTKGA
ncbi:MAG: hypothetical protein QM758_13745 [Armatimonas sp.]